MADYGYHPNTAANGAFDKIDGIYGSGVAAQDAPVEMGPFTMAGMAFEDVHNLVRRIQVLADRLSGPIPQQAGEAKPPIDHKPPLFAALRMESNRASSAVREAHDALERIERHLS